ncbi:MAG: hypothetical protein U1D55_02770 [Phycisphaerae bacterium]
MHRRRLQAVAPGDEQVAASRAPQWGVWTLAALVILVLIVLGAWVLWRVERADSTPTRQPVSPVRIDPLERAGIIERCPLDPDSRSHCSCAASRHG